MAKEIIGKCPLCGGDITESEKAFGCSNWREQDGGCKFAIWKNFYDKKITKSMAKALLEKGKTSVIKKWISRNTGKEFDAALKLVKDENGQYKVQFDFDK